MLKVLPADDLDLVLSLTPEFWSRFHGARLFMTGGTGFIGMWLVQVIQRANDKLGAGIELLVLSRDPELARLRAPAIFGRPDTRLIAGDVSTFVGALGKIDLCIHAATDVGNPGKVGAPMATFDSIVQGTRRILDAAQAGGATRFLLTSSGAVYGSQPVQLERISESYVGAPDSLQPGAAYGCGKRAAEWLACAYGAQAAGLEVSIARIFALLGPGLPLDGPFAAGNFVRDALAGEDIVVLGDGRPLRSYLYMADLCVWLLHILDRGTPGHAYNVGSESAVSIAQLACHVVAASGSQAGIVVRGVPSAELPARYVPATCKARQELGLAEYTSFEVALHKTIHWSRSTTAL